MRDRLIELLNKQRNGKKKVSMSYEEFADFLLANGVIVTQVKLEQKVYIPDDEWGRTEAVVENIEITHSGVCYEWVKYDVGVDETEVWDCGTFRDKDIGKTVFLSFEDYEKALAERSEK